MDRFSPDVMRLESGGRLVLWHRATGRHLALFPETLAEVERWTPGLAAPPDLAALARRLDDLHLLRESRPPDLSVMIPTRSRLVVTFPDVPCLWGPLPSVRTSGGFAYAERRLTDTELLLWRGANGSRSLAQVADGARVDLSEALAFFRQLTDPAVQAVQLRSRPLGARAPALTRLVAPERPLAHRSAGQVGPSGETLTANWHLSEIVDGDTHFDDRETTVAHAFAVPHPALDGQRYGARLHQVLDERGLLPDDGTTVEVGPGDGELGESWLDRAARTGRPRGEHVRLDASPELLATQRRRQPGTRELLGSATELPFTDGSVSLLLSNEVIADLVAVPFDPDDGHHDGLQREVGLRIDRYGIQSFSGRALYNLGAWLMIEEVARALAPGGVAWISEFGGIDEIPQETTHLDHPEVSINFGHLLSIARAHGLQAACTPLADFLQFDLGATWLSRYSYEALRARMRAEGCHLSARAWTPETLGLPWRVEGLTWVPVGDEGPGPLVTRFMALVLRKD